MLLVRMIQHGWSRLPRRRAISQYTPSAGNLRQFTGACKRGDERGKTRLLRTIARRVSRWLEPGSFVFYRIRQTKAREFGSQPASASHLDLARALNEVMFSTHPTA